MKKGKIIILIVLSMILVAEGVLYFTGSKSYADISEKLKATAVDEENGTLLNCQNISIDGRNYTQLICQIKKGEARIISLKTKDSELVIPNRIGSYPVKVVGGNWTEIPEARWMAENQQKTVDLGVASWMEDETVKYKSIKLEEGIQRVEKESFYGVKTEKLELPSTFILAGALSFAQADIGELVCHSKKVYRQWGAFWNTPYVNQFPEVTEEYIRDRIFGTEESTQAYEVTKDSICVHQSINLKEMEKTDAHIMILDQPVNFEDSNCNIEDSQEAPEYDTYFSKCSQVSQIKMAASDARAAKNGEFYAQDNMLVYKNPKKGVYACPVTRQGKITLADDIWDVYDCAFEKCDKITEVQLPASVRWAGAAAFSYMSSCKKITVDEKSKYLKSVDGVLFTKDGQVLIAYPAGKKDSVYQVPKGVRVIADGAFMGAEHLKQINLTTGMYYVGEKAFADCKNLKYVRCKDSVQYIMKSAYEGCDMFAYASRPKRKKFDNTCIEAFIDWKNRYKYLDYLDKAAVYKLRYTYEGKSFYEK